MTPRAAIRCYRGVNVFWSRLPRAAKGGRSAASARHVVRVKSASFVGFVACIAAATAETAPATKTTSTAATTPGGFVAPSLAVPANGGQSIEIISPTVLELTAIVGGSPKIPPDGTIPSPPRPTFAPGEFAVTVGGTKVEVKEIGFRRRAVYAPLKQHDLRIGHFVYLRLATPIDDGKTVEVTYNGNVAWLAKAKLRATADPLRIGPAIHINQVGFVPDGPKSATVSYYLGDLGELPLPAQQNFEVIDVRTGKVVYRGELVPRPDRKMPQGWYQQVAEAEFHDLRGPGEFRVVVPGHGASYPFFVDAGIAAAFARTYALGLYHQRCGTTNMLPYTRFTHEACHLAPAEIPTGDLRKLKGFDETAPDANQYPFVRRGKVDVSKGHHDAGDYSKYTINSAGLIHHLMIAVDAFAGVAALDNLGLPESGDGKSDLLQAVKWEADFLAKMQDEDGGFYFLVYPRDRRYEDDVLPEKGDPQIVWPKNTAGTAAAVAALAQCASSPKFRALYPEEAKKYLEVARRGWKFLAEAEKKHGKGKTYKKFTHYGDLFDDADEFAWAACELFLATGEPEFEQQLSARLDPRDPKTRRWGWRRLSEAYGNAIRSYAFAATSGRLPATKLDSQMLLRCEEELVTCADEWMKAARDSAYGTSYPEPSKRVVGGGWYFSTDQAFDLAVAAQLTFPQKADKRPALREMVYSNLNYEAGGNPVNICYITGLGWKRPLEIVHQYAQNDRRRMPVPGIPIGSIQDGFTWFYPYKGEIGAMSYPQDGAKTSPYPIYDRWGDTFNLKTEFVVTNQARALALSAWLMAQTPAKDQPWKAAKAEITGAPAAADGAKVGQPVTLKLKIDAAAKDLDLTSARVIWEGRDNLPVYTQEFTFTPKHAGEQWVEAEAQWPDGRRVFALATFSAK
jgi:hypothetical protein